MTETREIKVQTVMSEKHLTPLRAIRLACLECCAGSAHEVKLCHIDDCALWIYRMGRNPRRAGLGGRPQEAQKTHSGSAKAEEAGSGRRDARTTSKAGRP